MYNALHTLSGLRFEADCSLLCSLKFLCYRESSPWRDAPQPPVVVLAAPYLAPLIYKAVTWRVTNLV